MINLNYSTSINNSIKKVDTRIIDSYKQLSTGLRINSASDDSAGLMISTRLKAFESGKTQSVRNIEDGLSFLQVAEGSIGTIQDIFQRIRELSVQADNSTYSLSDKQSMQNEIEELLKEVDHIATTTTFNHLQVMADPVGNLTLHIDETSTGTMDIRLYNLKTAALGIDWIDVSINAQAAINAVDTVMNNISNMRSEYGAYMNRLEVNLQNLHTAYSTNKASKSRIEEAQAEVSMSNLVKNEILKESASRMLKFNGTIQSEKAQTLLST